MAFSGAKGIYPQYPVGIMVDSPRPTAATSWMAIQDTMVLHSGTVGNVLGRNVTAVRSAAQPKLYRYVSLSGLHRLFAFRAAHRGAAGEEAPKGWRDCGCGTHKFRTSLPTPFSGTGYICRSVMQSLLGSPFGQSAWGTICREPGRAAHTRIFQTRRRQSTTGCAASWLLVGGRSKPRGRSPSPIWKAI
jgi:hypothetical protein